MRLLSFLFVWMVSANVLAQTAQFTSGFIYDANSKEALIGASVYEPKSKSGTVTNAYGYFSLASKTGGDSIVVSFIGYQPQKINIKPSGIIKIYLEPGIAIGEVTIKDNRVSRPELGINRVQIHEIKNLPTLFGEVDIIKSFQMMPGVQSGGEGKSELYVRGGTPDQNLILLDDVPLYYVAHFGGFFSVFNADAINSAELIKGGFPARFGGRLSSVLDITMREGNMEKQVIQGTIGLLTSKLAVEAPVIKGKSSFLVSARKNLLPVFSLMDTGLKYRFYDVNAKGNYIINPQNRLYMSFYMGSDAVIVETSKESKQFVKWGNIMGGLRWNQVWSNQLFSNLTLYSTNYQYHTHFNYKSQTDSTTQKYSDDLYSTINDLGLKYDLNLNINSNIGFKYGVSVIHHRFAPNNEVLSQSGTNVSELNEVYNSTIGAFENGIYAETHVNYEKFTANTGLRFANYLQDSARYNSFEPRVILSYQLAKNVSVKYGYSFMRQFIHLLSYSGTGLPSDYWMPTTASVKPENSMQNSLGVYCNLFGGNYTFSTEAYYKTMDNLVDFKPGSSLSGSLSDWETAVETGGTGQNYGIEWLLQKEQGNTTGWMSFTLSKARRRFDNINQGKEYPFKYDRLVDFSIVLTHQLKEGITISGTWVYGSGYPVTLASELYFFEGNDVFVYTNKNSYRMRAYHRLDLGINFTKKTRLGERTWNISIMNVYNRKNPYFYYYERDNITVVNETEHGIGFDSKPGALKLKQMSLFGFLPSFAYSFKF